MDYIPYPLMQPSQAPLQMIGNNFQNSSLHVQQPSTTMRPNLAPLQMIGNNFQNCHLQLQQPSSEEEQLRALMINLNLKINDLHVHLGNSSFPVNNNNSVNTTTNAYDLGQVENLAIG